jgi:hypothetical protein
MIGSITSSQPRRLFLSELARLIIGPARPAERAIPMFQKARVVDAFLVGDVVRQHRMRPYATRAMHQWQDFVHRHSSLHFVALRLDLPFVLAHYPDLNAIADPLDAARAVERKFTPLGLAC